MSLLHLYLGKNNLIILKTVEQTSINNFLLTQNLQKFALLAKFTLFVIASSTLNLTSRVGLIAVQFRHLVRAWESTGEQQGG